MKKPMIAFWAGIASCLILQWFWRDVQDEFLSNVIFTGPGDNSWTVNIGGVIFDSKSGSAIVKSGKQPVLAVVNGRATFGVLRVGENYLSVDPTTKALKKDRDYLELGEVNLQELNSSGQ